MNTVACPTTFVEYYAQCQTPDGALLYGTAHNTPFGWLFIDEAGLDPFYTDKRALVLCGQVALSEAQAVEDRGRLWASKMLATGCQVAA